jgi:prepilin-type N-terminal cleavage/methylation domain-containing protein
MRCRKGFSLMELLMAVALGALLLLAGGSALTRLQTQMRLYTGAALFASSLQTARSEALSKGAAIEMQIAPTGTAFVSVPRGSAAPSDWQTLPSGVSFTRAPASNLTFYSRGVAVPAATYHLTASRWSAEVVVAGGGRIRWRFLDDS